MVRNLHFQKSKFLTTAIQTDHDGLETSMEHARQVIPPIMGTLEPSEQGVIFRRTASQLDWIAHVLINLDFPIHIVQPVELRNLLRQIAEKALRMAGE